MAMLPDRVSLGDILDAEAFVCAAIDRRLSLTPDQREELVAEGLALLVKLHSTYKPGHGGGDPARSSFAGYASIYLRKQLGVAYGRMRAAPEAAECDEEFLEVLDPASGVRRRWLDDEIAAFFVERLYWALRRAAEARVAGGFRRSS